MSVRVSDHALLRYLERAGGLDIEGLRLALERSLAKASQAAESIDARDYRIVVDGLVYVVRGTHVVTVTTDRTLRWDRT